MRRRVYVCVGWDASHDAFSVIWILPLLLDRFTNLPPLLGRFGNTSQSSSILFRFFGFRRWSFLLLSGSGCCPYSPSPFSSLVFLHLFLPLSLLQSDTRAHWQRSGADVVSYSGRCLCHGHSQIDASFVLQSNVFSMNRFFGSFLDHFNLLCADTTDVTSLSRQVPISVHRETNDVHDSKELCQCFAV